MEFRHSLKTLKRTVVLVVVGTGYKWASSEIGMLGENLPRFNLQSENTDDLNQLIKTVSSYENVNDSAKENTEQKEKNETAEVNQIAFKETIELAQHKFLRQISGFGAELEVTYPRLILLDFIQSSSSDRPCSARSLREGFTEIGALMGHKLGFRFLCEHEQVHKYFYINIYIQVRIYAREGRNDRMWIP